MNRSFDNDELKKYRENQIYYHKEISTFDDMLCSLVNNIPLKDVNVDPEYQEFMTDLMKQEKTKTRDDIERKAIRKLYHDFGPSTFPKLLLVEDLQDAKYTEMYKRAVSGDYDF